LVTDTLDLVSVRTGTATQRGIFTGRSHEQILIGGVAVLAAATLLAGCSTQSNSNSVYTGGQAQREQTVRFGVVEGVREVMIQGEATGAGTLAGGAIGGVRPAARSAAAMARSQRACSARSWAAWPEAPPRTNRAASRPGDHRAPGERRDARHHAGCGRNLPPWRPCAAASSGRRDARYALSHALVDPTQQPNAARRQAAAFCFGASPCPSYS
jgi:hypothetical protein